MKLKGDAKIVEVAIQAAKIAGAIIKSYFRTNRDTFRDKDAKSAIVTAADTEAESAMRSIIEANFPDHGIEGEEFASKIGSSSYKWILDPIDGTSNFVMGKPVFGTLIAVFKNELPILGVIYQPILNEIFLGITNGGAFYNGARIKCAKNINNIQEALLASNPPYMFETKFERNLLWGLQKEVRASEFGGDCYNYAMLASGFIDIAIISRDDFHDFAAVIPIVKEAGGMITDWQGETLTSKSSGHILATSNEILHMEVLKKISEYKNAQ